MAFLDKVDEWIKEVEVRPGSALMILKLIAGRLRDLTERNEELLAENIALQNGSQVEEYKKRISHLEFQLDLLKRRLGNGDGLALENLVKTTALNLILYSSEGQCIRILLGAEGEIDAAWQKQLIDMAPTADAPRLLVVNEVEEAMLLFSSGRVGTLPVSVIAYQDGTDVLRWSVASVPDIPKGGEKLVSIMPLSDMPVSGYFLQVSRRGSVKKTMTSISEKIMSAGFLGRGAIHKSDEPFALMLANKNDLLVLVTHEGRVVCLDIEILSYSVEERIHLSFTDYIISAFILPAKENLVCVTKNGKVLQRERASLEHSKSANTRGMALISPQRLEQGIRLAGAFPSARDAQIVLIDSKGSLVCNSLDQICQAGSINTVSDIVAMAVFSHPEG